MIDRTIDTDPLVSPAWLADRLSKRGHGSEQGLVILDATLPPVGVSPVVDTHGRYLAEHLPGAVFFDIEQHSDRATSLPHMLPAAEFFASSMAELGVGSSMTIVVYEQAGVFSAPRARWMLRTMGAAEVFVLDGGLEAWRQAGFATESGPVTLTPAEFHARLDASAVKDYEHIAAQIAQSSDGHSSDEQAAAEASHQGAAQILDARPRGRFNGSAPEPRPGLPSGHMPGARSLPYTELVEAGRLKSADLLREVFRAYGIELDEPIITTCGSGITAAVVALGLERAGASQVALYDGSWAEYAQQPGARIEQTKPDS